MQTRHPPTKDKQTREISQTHRSRKHKKREKTADVKTGEDKGEDRDLNTQRRAGDRDAGEAKTPNTESI